MMEAVSTRHIPYLTLWTIIVSFAVSAQGDCPSSLGTPRKEVVCYFEGKRPVSSLDPCYCTHVIYTNIGLDEYSRVKVTQGVKTDLLSFKEANSKLSLILSLGGSAIKSGVFSSLINSEARFDNLTKSVGELYQDEIINGVEIDWEWPLQTGDKKDKDKLVQYAKQLKIAVENEVVVTPRSLRNRRAAEEEASTTTEQDFDGTTDPSTTPSYTTSSPLSDESTPAETTPTLDDNDDDDNSNDDDEGSSSTSTLSPSLKASEVDEDEDESDSEEEENSTTGNEDENASSHTSHTHTTSKTHPQLLRRGRKHRQRVTVVKKVRKSDVRRGEQQAKKHLY